MVNTIRIHRELGNFLGISSNLIKSEKELTRKIRNFSELGEKTLRKIYKIENHAIRISIHKEIKEHKLERIIIRKET